MTTPGSIIVPGTNPAKVLDTTVVTTSEGEVHREVIVKGSPDNADALQQVDETPQAARVVVYDAAGGIITDTTANALKALLVDAAGQAITDSTANSIKALLVDAAGVAITDSAINGARVILYDASGNPIDTDVDHIGSLVITGVAHEEIHERNTYEVGYHADVANNETLDILIQVGATMEIHIVHSVDAGGDATFNFYEGVTFGGAGTTLEAINCHRRPDIPSAEPVFTHTPTTPVPGSTLIIPEHFLIGGMGGKSGGADKASREENVLTVGVDYLVRMTNLSGQSKHMSMLLGFYEKPAP